MLIADMVDPLDDLKKLEGLAKSFAKLDPSCLPLLHQCLSSLSEFSRDSEGRQHLADARGVARLLALVPLLCSEKILLPDNGEYSACNDMAAASNMLSSVPDFSLRPLVMLWRLMRNLCANQQSQVDFRLCGAHALAAYHASQLSTCCLQTAGAALDSSNTGTYEDLLKATLQFLANFSASGEENCSALWASAFPDMFAKVSSHVQAGIQHPLCTTIFYCVRDSPARREALALAGHVCRQLLSASSSTLAGDGSQKVLDTGGGDSLELLLESLCITDGLLPRMLHALSPGNPETDPSVSAVSPSPRLLDTSGETGSHKRASEAAGGPSLSTADHLAGHLSDVYLSGHPTGHAGGAHSSGGQSRGYCAEHSMLLRYIYRALNHHTFEAECAQRRGLFCHATLSFLCQLAARLSHAASRTATAQIHSSAASMPAAAARGGSSTEPDEVDSSTASALDAMTASARGDLSVAPSLSTPSLEPGPGVPREVSAAPPALPCGDPLVDLLGATLALLGQVALLRVGGRPRPQPGMAAAQDHERHERQMTAPEDMQGGARPNMEGEGDPSRGPRAGTDRTRPTASTSCQQPHLEAVVEGGVVDTMVALLRALPLAGRLGRAVAGSAVRDAGSKGGAIDGGRQAATRAGGDGSLQADGRLPGGGGISPQPADVPRPTLCDAYMGYRRDIVVILANASHECTTVQDRVRALGGLPLLMQQCVEDASNPFLREWALWGLRNLLMDNAANQAEVEALQMQGTAQHLDLRSMGLAVETDEATGRPRLVNMNQGGVSVNQQGGGLSQEGGG
eukprot:jgi/Mesvir1/19153/Mv01176-RA.1